MEEKDIEALIKLQGTVEGPRNDDEYEQYHNERFSRAVNGQAAWLLRNHDPELDGRVWEYFSPARKDEVMQIRSTEYPDLYEASKGLQGEIGSGLVSLSTAVEFVENK